MSRKIIITVAQTGAFHGKDANPALPEQPNEIAASAYDCYNAGASVVHIHTRDKNGKSVCDTNVFGEINGLIRSKCNLILQNSTAPATQLGSKADDGLAALNLPKDLLPDMCSLDCSIMATAWKDVHFIYEWTWPWLISTGKKMKELGIKPEFECFNPMTVEDVFNVLRPTGYFDDPISMTFVMGMKVSQGAISYSMENLDFMISKIPQGFKANFSTMGIGATQLEATMHSLLKGGNVRVGFEDNIYYRRGELAKSNAQLVERIVRIIRELDMEIATPDEAREMLNIKRK